MCKADKLKEADRMLKKATVSTTMIFDTTDKKLRDDYAKQAFMYTEIAKAYIKLAEQCT